MKVARVHIRAFRNHSDSVLEFGSGLNVITGGNGQGKTNILEAISYFGLTKSFFTVHDTAAMQIGSEGFAIDGSIVSDSGTVADVGIRYDRQTGKKEISVNRAPLGRHHELVGRFPVVVLSPESSRITTGPPGERRRFLDMVLAQRSRSYLEDLLEYRKALKQRNALLAEGKRGEHAGREVLDPWTKNLACLGSRIIGRRREFVSSFRSTLSRTHAGLAGGGEEIGIEYRTAPDTGEARDDKEIADRLSDGFERMRMEELKRGMTLVGPHRDDLALTINGTSLQDHGSQGQHKTLLLSMKVSEFEHLSRELRERPVLLLDDLFGELDRERSARIIDLVSHLGQSLITTTWDGVLNGRGSSGEENRRFLIENGTCRVN